MIPQPIPSLPSRLAGSQPAPATAPATALPAALAGAGSGVTTGTVWLRHRASDRGSLDCGAGAGRAHQEWDRPGWRWQEVAGRFVEVTGPAALTAAVGLVADAQLQGETTLWLGRTGSSFYPPDAVTHGIDLDALPVLLLPDTKAVLQAADTVLRSGGFGLVVLDRIDPADLALSAQQRLGGLARQQNTGLVALSSGAPSARRGLGGRRRSGTAGRGAPRSSLVSLRVAAAAERIAPGRFVCSVQAAKDKRRSQEWHWQEDVRGPLGMR